MRIGFFGCSFTEGGGLDSLEWNDYALKNNLISDDWDIKKSISDYHRGHHIEDRYDLVTQYRDKHRFSNLVGEKLDCKTKNHSESCNSNEHILNELHNNLENYDIFVVQLTLLNRVHWYYEPTQKFYNLNNFDVSNHPYNNNPKLKKLAKHYEDWCTYIYNVEQVREQIHRQVQYFNSLGKKIYWITWDDFDNIKEEKNLIKFKSKLNDICLSKYSYENGTYFTELTNGVYHDSHLSPEGHKIVADKIIRSINV